MPRPARAAVLALLAALAAPPAAAQSLLDRPPNLSGAWVGSSGRMYFHFLHRFTASPAPERKVSNVPTFTVAAGLPAGTLVGVNYSTNSRLAPRYPNEWEAFVRTRFLSQDGGAPLDVAAQGAYNIAAEGVDGELSVARRQGPLRLIAAGRVLSDPFEAGNPRFAAAGGATLRIGRYLALAGDVASLLDREEDERIAWGAGLHIAIPHTPHTLSLHAANTDAGTLQGASRGGEEVRYGFEFTVPLTLARWFGSGGEAPAGQSPPPPPPSGEAAAESVDPEAPVVRASIRSMSFAPARIEIDAGTTIRWTNDDPLAHTVTADGGAFDSGLVESGESWSRTFTEPGTYPFHCTPHPFMKGEVVVR